ncbi:hypothetical protein PsorP6_017910 [Peronosclerospora sorghi]|uniref:Uncharacterized protein n=1 Tax=Peronosclerospora sorghi TaxID=230839 RepID=A0ACC0WDK3_9STRA|nr:hypothetical protein PsorP6_017910 [Peronosclerospora sorghi]
METDWEGSKRNTMSLPLRLKNKMESIASAFSECQTEPNASKLLAQFIRKFTIASDTKLLTNSDGMFSRAFKKVRNIFRSEEVELLSDDFRKCMTEPLAEARRAWFEAVEAVLAVAGEVMPARMTEEKKKAAIETCQQDRENIFAEARREFLKSLRTHPVDELTTFVTPYYQSNRKIKYDTKEEVWKPATQQVKIFKLVREGDGPFRSSELGAHRLRADASILAAYTIKNRSVILVTTASQGTLVDRISFPFSQSYWTKSQETVTQIRAFGRAVPQCDFNVNERLIAFVEEGGRVGLYRFNESYSSLEVYKNVELSLRTSLTLPVANCLLVDGYLYAIDKVGSIQSVNLKNQQTSRVARIVPAEKQVTSLFTMADNMVLGFMARTEADESSVPDQQVELCAISSEDFRKIPVSDSLVVLRRLHGGSVECFNNMLFALDETQGKIYVRELVVTVRSESYRIRQSQQHSVNGTSAEAEGSTHDGEHWLRAFYHIYEKFPVRGLIRGVDDSSVTLKLHLTCSSALSTSSKDNCRYFFQAVMRDLRKLNKPLVGMDLARDLTFVTDASVVITNAVSRPVGSLIQELQEDVFLSILNASISRFTIFRMEMRLDKEIDDLFARFQKGVALIKGDPNLFRGKLYMSVKDVNPNDQRGVMDEFVAKFQQSVGTTRDNNFLLDMYSGQLDINCSPPLGTTSYYQSLMHAQNFIEQSLCGSPSAGFQNGKTFLNCIRLVLAKIAILDWTSLDESAKQFQLSEITSKLSGLLRTGCIVPQEQVVKNEDITRYLKEDITLSDGTRKYKAGEGGIAEMCNLYCSKMGREHVHYIDCEQGSQDSCVYTGSASDQRRHCTRPLEPKPKKPMDEVLHEQFWKTLGWKDPCTSKVELELFGKCAYKCDAPEHDDKPSYCILPAWHKEEAKPHSFDGFSYVSGHKFECSHVASGGKMHHVFVLDCSGSMSGRPWDDLMAAWKEYIYNRLADGASMDLVSVVTFDSHAEIVYEGRNITTMTNCLIRYRGGGTNYAAGLRSANEVLSRMAFDQYKPAIIFFSDGHPSDPLQGEQVATHIRECYEKNGLQAFAVGFGSINLNTLQRVAEKLGGAYHHVLTGNELKATFFSISASLSTRVGLALATPDHERNCVICEQDMASGEKVKLNGCRHELHKICLDVLVRNTEQDQEVLRCPSCRREFST